MVKIKIPPCGAGLNFFVWACLFGFSKVGAFNKRTFGFSRTLEVGVISEPWIDSFSEKDIGYILKQK